MRRVLVAGAGGGIGMALVDALAARPETERVHALHRRPVSSASSRVTWHCVDPDDGDTQRCAIERIGNEGSLDGVIIATGLLHGPGQSPEKALNQVSAKALIDSYASNAVAPLLLLADLKPLLKRWEPDFVCILSARIGSISDNRLGGWYGYRMAKAALNMAVKTVALELTREQCSTKLVAVHPGTTRTALSHRFLRHRRQSVSSPEESAARLIDLLERLEPGDSGEFLNYDGTPIPW